MKDSMDKYRLMLLQEDDGGGGGDSGEASQGMSVFEGDTAAPPPRTETSQPERGHEAPPTRPEAPTVDARVRERDWTAFPTAAERDVGGGGEAAVECMGADAGVDGEV